MQNTYAQQIRLPTHQSQETTAQTDADSIDSLVSSQYRNEFPNVFDLTDLPSNYTCTDCETLPFYENPQLDYRSTDSDSNYKPVQTVSSVVR